MKLGCLGIKPKNITEISTFSGVFMYYLSEQFDKIGIEQVWARSNAEAVRLSGCDHILAFGNRWFSHYGGADAMQELTDGAVAQIAENPRQDKFVDQTFTINQTGGRRCTHIDWAADPTLFYPDEEKYIILDHPTYNEYQQSMMDEILGQARKYNGKFKVKRLLADGLHEIEDEVEEFKRTAEVPYQEMAAITRKAAIFVVTHRESCGLQCLEASMSGAVVVYPKGFLNENRAEVLPSIEFNNQVPWGLAEKLYESGIAREHVIHFTWDKPAKRIIDFFTNWAENREQVQENQQAEGG